MEVSSLEEEVARLRHMVRVMADVLVECGVVDQSMIEQRLRMPPSLMEYAPPARPGFWSRLFGRRALDVGAVPSVIISGETDRTVEVQRLPFEVQSLYDEPGAPTSASSPRTIKARG